MKSCLALVTLTFLILTIGSVAGIYLTVRALNEDSDSTTIVEEKMPIQSANEASVESATMLEVISE